MSISRVPTYASQNLYLSRMASAKATLFELQYSVASGQKSMNYAGISRQTFSLLTFESEAARNTQFLTSNATTKAKIEAMSLSLNNIKEETSDFRNTLRSLLELDLENIAPDYFSDPPQMVNEDTMNEIRNVQQQAFNTLKAIGDYLNIQIDGEYVFAGGKTNKLPVDIPFSSLKEFQEYYDGLLVTAPESLAANLSKYIVRDDITGGFRLTQDIVKIGFNDETGTNAAVTGTFSYSVEDNKITVPAGSAAGIKPGGLITLSGTEPNGLNDGEYIVSSVTDTEIRLDANTPLKSPPIPTYVGGVNPETRLPLSMTISNSETSHTKTIDFTGVDVTLDPVTGKISTNQDHIFATLRPGDKIVLSGTILTDPPAVDNDAIEFTVSEVSENGRDVSITAGTAMNSPPILDQKMNGNPGNLIIAQNMDVGFIDAINPNGKVITTLNTGTQNAVADGNTITVDPAAMNDFFKNVKPGQMIDISGFSPASENNGTAYVTDVDLVTGEITIDRTLTAETANNISFDLMSLEHGFVSENILGGEDTTGNIYFNTDKNQMMSQKDKAFATLRPGDTIVIEGTENNNGVKYIKSISEDGKTVTFSDETPIKAEGTPLNPPNDYFTMIENGTGVNIGKSYPIGSTVDLSHISPDYNGSYTIIGVSEDGNRLIVKADNFPQYPLTAPSIDFPATGKGEIASSSYYQGDQFESKVRVDENTILDVGVNAEDGAFEKVIRALMIIAQGNLVDTRDPLEANDGVDPNQAIDRVNEAMALLDDALSHNGTLQPDESPSDLSQLDFQMGLNLANIGRIMDDQTYMKTFLANQISSIENVPDELITAALFQQQLQMLEYSYAALATVNSLSILNYL